MGEEKKSVVAVIPARFQSTRFPGKPLVKIGGIPMIQRVYERVVQANSIAKVIIATDDQRIFDVVEGFGGTVMMTRKDHETGTDRLVEAASSLQCEWVINVQGDEPLIDPGDLDNLIKKTLQQSAKVGTLIYPIQDPKMIEDPNIVKAVVNKNMEALYFSRAPIPFQKLKKTKVWRHIGVYLFQRDFLIEYNQWPQTDLELTEGLEQLRILDNGYSIYCAVAQHDGGGVDCPEDIAIVEKRIKESSM